MKTLIVGLLSFLALVACATTAKTPIPQMPPASKGFCTANDGIFVILIDDKGKTVAFACPDIKGRRITQPAQRPPEVNIPVGTVHLGKVEKFRAQDETDPCVDWTSGGVTHHVCW